MTTFTMPIQRAVSVAGLSWSQISASSAVSVFLGSMTISLRPSFLPSLIVFHRRAIECLGLIPETIRHLLLLSAPGSTPT